MGKKYKRYETLKFVLDTEEKKKAGLSIIASRQKLVEGYSLEKNNLVDMLKKASPDLAEKLLVCEKNFAAEKKILKETIAGIKNEPFTVIANVIVQPSKTPGYIEMVDNMGTGIILLVEPGIESDISYEE